MDKLSIFASGSEVALTSEGNKTLDDVIDGLDENASKLDGVLRQLNATHKGHEVEDWDKEVPILMADEAIEEADESESPFDA